MKPNEVARYLQRAALDYEFRALARRDPDASFEGFSLTEEERRILRRQDSELMTLLARALGAGAEEDGSSPGREPAEGRAPPPPLPSLPPIDLLLQLLAIPAGETGGSGIAHAASLHPAPAPGDPPPPPPPEAPAGAAEPVYFRIRLTPVPARAADGSLTVAYGSSIEGLIPGAEEEPPPASPASAWNHQLDSEAARGAAAAVKAAAPGERYERLLDLVAAITGHRDARGEDS